MGGRPAWVCVEKIKWWEDEQNEFLFLSGQSDFKVALLNVLLEKP